MNFLDTLNLVLSSTGIYHITSGQILMIAVGLCLLYLGIKKGFAPLVLIPIGFGGILANIPLAGFADLSMTVIDPSAHVMAHTIGGFMGQFYSFGIESGLFPILIIMGVGALTDFGPLIAQPMTALLGAAAQFGVFFTLIGALLMSRYLGFDFNFRDAASIGMMGGADGPTSIFLASRLSPRFLGSIAVVTYSYIALVPVMLPPILKLLTTKKERAIKMEPLRMVAKNEKIIFPLVVLILCIFLLPSATPLIAALTFGNLLRECGVMGKLSATAQKEMINLVTILLGVAVGSKLSADPFLTVETIGILVLGLVAFFMSAGSGILFAKVLARFSKNPINPMIGAAGVSAVSMSAHVVHKLGQEVDPSQDLLMHAMGANVSGLIGSVVAAGILLSLVPFFS